VGPRTGLDTTVNTRTQIVQPKTQRYTGVRSKFFSSPNVMEQTILNALTIFSSKIAAAASAY